MSESIKVTTSVVLFNPSLSDIELLFKTYRMALLKANKVYNIQGQVILVDNNPNGMYQSDVEVLAKNLDINYQYIVSEINGGYGYGHNQAIDQTNSNYHIICNPDIEFLEDTIVDAVEYMQTDKETILLTPSVFGKDGERQYLCKRNPKLFHLFLRRFAPIIIKNTLFKNYLNRFEYKDKSYEAVMENIPFCTGCFMFFRTITLKQLNGFDEQFFMYLEDADLSRRALELGKIIYLPNFKVIHRWERGAYKNKKLRNAAIKSAFKYWRKWGGIF